MTDEEARVLVLILGKYCGKQQASKASTEMNIACETHTFALVASGEEWRVKVYAGEESQAQKGKK